MRHFCRSAVSEFFMFVSPRIILVSSIKHSFLWVLSETSRHFRSAIVGEKYALVAEIPKKKIPTTSIVPFIVVYKISKLLPRDF